MKAITKPEAVSILTDHNTHHPQWHEATAMVYSYFESALGCKRVLDGERGNFYKFTCLLNSKHRNLKFDFGAALSIYSNDYLRDCIPS